MEDIEEDIFPDPPSLGVVPLPTLTDSSETNETSLDFEESPPKKKPRARKRKVPIKTLTSSPSTAVNSIVKSEGVGSSDKNIKAFQAITEFISALVESFNMNTANPLTLYHRLISHIKPGDTIAINKSVGGFIEFFEEFGKHIFSGALQNIPPGTRINYGDGKTAYISIQLFLHKSAPDAREIIRQHLMTVAAILQPERIVEAKPLPAPAVDPDQVGSDPSSIPIPGVDLATAEGKFINTIMNKARVSMANVNVDNPAMAGMALMQSGIMQEMMAGLNNGVDGGSFNMVSLMSQMQGAMALMMAPGMPQPDQNLQNDLRAIEGKK